MKTTLLPLLFSFAAIAPVHAITDAEIAPAALVGKTLTFTIVNGGSPYATTGTWSGAFASSGNAFTATKITGDFVNISTTFSAAASGGFTNVSLAKIVEGQKAATLTLYTVSGVGHYEVSIQDVFGVSLNGTFVIGAPAVKSPEIGITASDFGKLSDGKSTVRLISPKAGKTGPGVKFTIKNSGKGKLTGLVIGKSGANKSDFKVSALAQTSLAPGADISFKVSYKASSKNKEAATLRIYSNDANESPFDIKLSGQVDP